MKKIRIHYRILVLLAAFSFLAGGCCSFSTTKSLGKAKDLAGKGDYAAVTGLAIDCDASCEGCNQLHLLKGDACYRLAKNGQEPLKHYPCAVAELAEGIRLTKQWQMEAFNLNRPQTYTNLCESLRNWRDLSKGSEADAIDEQLLKTSREYLSAEPGNPCAIYFLNNAEYAGQRACLLHPENCPSLCTKLQGMQQSIADGIAKPAGAGCEANLKELGGEVAQAKEIAHCQ